MAAALSNGRHYFTTGTVAKVAFDELLPSDAWREE